MPEIRFKIAVFIDFDNIEIGVKNTLNAQFDIGVVLEALKERGDVVSKIAYGDWTRAGDHSRSLTQHATKLVQRNLTPGGDKNGADINLALDALEMAFTHSHISAYVIVGGDSDFISLVEKLKQYDKTDLRRRRSLVHEPGDAAELPRVHRVRKPDRRPARRSRIARPGRPGRLAGAGGAGGAAAQARAEGAHGPRGHAAARTAQEHAAAARLDVLGAHLRGEQLPRLRGKAGRRRFRDASRGRPQHPRGVERGRSFAPARRRSARRRNARRNRRRRSRIVRLDARPGQPSLGTPRPAEAVAEVRRLFQAALQPPRWPMYVRQVKQYLRGVDPSFDERTYRLPEPERSAARLPEGGPVPDGARPPGCRALLPGQRDEGGGADVHPRRRYRRGAAPCRAGRGGDGGCRAR